MNITPDTRIADIATAKPATIKVFQRYNIDFCCGGKRPLAEACQERHMTFGELRFALEAAEAAGRPDLPSAEAPLQELVRFIVDHYHADLREELPRLGQMAAKVLNVHGGRHPEVIPALEATFRALREELEMHMMKEERVLFPYVVRLEEMAAAGRTLPTSPFGSIDAPIGAMEHEHDDAGRALARMRELTRGYRPPEGACNTFRGLYHGLEQLETALHEHIHLENNVLFPRAARLERELMGREVGSPSCAPARCS
jgi:regulator of cell morphogenesis and NO signaling